MQVSLVRRQLVSGTLPYKSLEHIFRACGYEGINGD